MVLHRRSMFFFFFAFTLASTAIPVVAQTFVPISLSAVANDRLQLFHPAYPSGVPVTLGGVPFNIAPIGNNAWNGTIAAHDGAGTFAVALPVNLAGVTGVDTLINTIWGETSAGTFLSLTFTFSDATSFTKNLDGNVDVRDYYDNTYTNGINGTTTTNVFNTDVDGPKGPNMYRLDKQFIDLTAFSSKTLSFITLSDAGNYGFQRALLSGVTVVTSSPSFVPEPGTITLFLAGGLAGVGLFLRRRLANRIT